MPALTPFPNTFLKSGKTLDPVESLRCTKDFKIKHSTLTQLRSAVHLACKSNKRGQCDASIVYSSLSFGYAGAKKSTGLLQTMPFAPTAFTYAGNANSPPPPPPSPML